MAKRSVTHDTFTIERVYNVSPARVFAAWSQPEAKARWFSGPEEWESAEASMDFRVGGREINRGGPKGGPVHSFEGLYHDIVPNKRIVYSYDLHVDDVRISISLATVDLVAEGANTRLIFTEQGAYLDGYDNAGERRRGTNDMFDALGKELARF
jgi:uncharacterized protein YndB with AHSA1/START domain